MREQKREKLLEIARKLVTDPNVRVEDDAQVSPGREPGDYFVEAWVRLSLPALSPGHKVSYEHYGQQEESEIMHVSGDGKILFLENGRWKHIGSCKLVLEAGQIADHDL